MTGVPDFGYSVGYDYTTPSLVTAPGATSAVVGGLEHAPVRYYFAVRARDEAGNEDDNTHEVDGVAGYDHTKPEFAGCETVAQASPSTIRVSWKEATDAETPASRLEYRIWMSDTAAGARAHDRPPDQTIIGAAEATFSVPRGHRYYFHCQSVDVDGNADDNDITKEILFDDPPGWPNGYDLGWVSIERTMTEILWSEAEDDATDPQDLVYIVRLHPMNGGEDIVLDSAPGATRMIISGLEPGQGYSVELAVRDHGGQVTVGFLNGGNDAFWTKV